jgi:transposase-like protein
VEGLKALDLKLPNREEPNRIEPDHRRSKRRVRPMPGFKAMTRARAILGGTAMFPMIRNEQATDARNPQSSLAEQVETRAA